MLFHSKGETISGLNVSDFYVSPFEPYDFIVMFSSHIMSINKALSQIYNPYNTFYTPGTPILGSGDKLSHVHNHSIIFQQFSEQVYSTYFHSNNLSIK